MKLTLQEIERQLNEGLDRTPEEREKCLKWLTEFYNTNKMTLAELNELCWADSDWVFDQIFN